VGVVGLDDEAVALVIDVVLVPGTTRRDDARLPERLGRRDQVQLGGFVIARVDHHVVLGRGRRDADEEARVPFLVDDLVGRCGLADDVPAHLKRSPVLVDDGVEEHCLVVDCREVVVPQPAVRILHGNAVDGVGRMVALRPPAAPACLDCRFLS